MVSQIDLVEVDGEPVRPKSLIRFHRPNNINIYSSMNGLMKT